jgi:hypothetical protein
MYTLDGPHLSEVHLLADGGPLYDEGMPNDRDNNITL